MKAWNWLLVTCFVLFCSFFFALFAHAFRVWAGYKSLYRHTDSGYSAYTQCSLHLGRPCCQNVLNCFDYNHWNSETFSVFGYLLPFAAWFQTTCQIRVVFGERPRHPRRHVFFSFIQLYFSPGACHARWNEMFTLVQDKLAILKVFWWQKWCWSALLLCMLPVSFACVDIWVVSFRPRKAWSNR